MVRVVTTGPIVLDEGGRAGQGFIEISGDVAQVLKSYVAPGQLYAWQTATGQRFPAASGIVITANELRVIDRLPGGRRLPGLSSVGRLAGRILTPSISGYWLMKQISPTSVHTT